MAKFTTGKVVRFAHEKGHKQDAAHKPKKDTVGVVLGYSKIGNVKVRWPVEATSGDGIWYCAEDDLEAVNTACG